MSVEPDAPVAPDPSKDWVPVSEKLEAANLSELLAIFGGYPTDPNVSG